MSTVIVAPHPDDEWIGCGCTLLKKLDDGEKITVLLITHSSRIPTSRIKDRTKISQSLAKEYGYALKILGETELHINKEKLTSFLLKEINSGDIVYIPDYDRHIDHRVIFSACKDALKNNELVQYCVYNNSANPFTRMRKKALYFLFKRGFPSFKYGREEYKFSYKLDLKNKHITQFRAVPRDADVLRELTATNLIPFENSVEIYDRDGEEV